MYRAAFYDTPPYWVVDARRGAAALLSSLKSHHDFTIPIPEGWSPRKIDPPISFAPKPIWFSVEDATVIEPKIADIKRAACQYFGISKIDMDSARRTLKLVYPRQIAMYLARSLTGRSLPEIGRRFGGRDHTTVLHGARKIDLAAKTDWLVAYDIASVEALI